MHYGSTILSTYLIGRLKESMILANQISRTRPQQPRFLEDFDIVVNFRRCVVSQRLLDLKYNLTDATEVEIFRRRTCTLFSRAFDI